MVQLPENLGSVSFDGLLRFASLDIAYNPGGIWVLAFSMLSLFALMASLLIPRRRVWVRQLEDGTIELAALARGDDAKLDDFLLRVKTSIENEIAK